MFKKYVFALTIIMVMVVSACGPAATSQPPAVEATKPPVVEPTKPPVVEPTKPPAGAGCIGLGYGFFLTGQKALGHA